MERRRLYNPHQFASDGNEDTRAILTTLVTSGMKTIIYLIQVAFGGQKAYRAGLKQYMTTQAILKSVRPQDKSVLA